MTIKFSLLAALTAAALCTGVALAQDTAPKGNAQNGKQLFVKDGCYECHGYGAQGASSSGPRLGPDALPYDAFIRQLRTPAKEMPPYEAALVSDSQANDIYAFISTVPKSPDPKSIQLLNMK
jgi:mono/diheme cytochrome c family protein